MYEYESIIIEKTEGIAILWFNRPDKLNAMNWKMNEDFFDAVCKLDADKEVRVIIITGKGKAFAVGADIDEVSTATPEWMAGYNRLWMETFRKMEMTKKPIIAALNGYTNMEVYQACDLVIAAEGVKIGLPEIKIGVKPGAGIDQRLPRWIGRFKAKEILFFGDWLDANEAERVGIVNKVVPKEKLMDEAISWARKLNSLSPHAIGAAKLAVNVGAEMDLNEGLEYQLALFLDLFHTKEQKEGMKAFLASRGK
jgi:enoyl-CoA hydratase